MWNDRYRTPEYVYGKEPNTYLVEELKKIKPGRILFPGEGEGRNAVYAATLGWEVHAFDSSSVGREKALLLADERKVSIAYELYNYEEYAVNGRSVHAVGLFYTHQPSELRRKFHRKIVQTLHPGGIILLEGFSKKQMANNSGGPKSLDFLYSVDELAEDFKELQIQKLNETVRELNEGDFHQGKADLIQLIAMK